MASKEAKKVDNAIRAHEDSADPNTVSMYPGRDSLGRFVQGQEGLGNAASKLRSRDVVDEQFPTNALGAQDPRDEIMSEKLASQDAVYPGITPFGQLIAKDSDFEWARRKREAEAYANFQQWFALNFDKMSPPQKEMAKKLFPRFYQERLQQLKRTVELQEKLARLKLLGPENANDLMLQYAAEAGFIEADPLHHILHPEEAAKQKADLLRKERYSRGLLNPRRLARGDWGTGKRKDNAEAIFGKERIPGGNNAAFNLGVGDAGFSSFGRTSDDYAQPDAEHQGLFKQQLDFLERFTK